MARRVVISIVVEGAAADGLASTWPRGEIPEAFRHRVEEALFLAVPTDVSRDQLQRGTKVSAIFLAPAP